MASFKMSPSGAKLLELNNYTYYHHRTNKESIAWICVRVNQGCRGRAISRGDEAFMSQNHNHPPLSHSTPTNIPTPISVNRNSALMPLNDGKNFKFRHPFNMIVNGSTQAGKTEWILKLLKNLSYLVDTEFRSILFCHGVDNPKLRVIKDIAETWPGLPTEEMLQATPKPALVILDDLMPEAKSKYLEKIFTRGSHHWDMSVIFVTQDMFHKELKTARNNSQYLICLKNPAGELQMRNLGIQLFPNKQKFFMDSYKNATEKEFGYLLIDLHPKTPKAPVLRSNIFPDEAPAVYQMGPTGEMLSTNKDQVEFIERAQARNILNDPKENALLEVSDSLNNILGNPNLSNTEKYIHYDQMLKRQKALMKEKEEKLQNISLNAMNPEVMNALAEQFRLHFPTNFQPPVTSQPQVTSQTESQHIAAPQPNESQEAIQKLYQLFQHSNTLPVTKQPTEFMNATLPTNFTPKITKRNEEISPEVMNANTTDIRRKKFEEKQKRMEEFADDLLNHFDQNAEYYRIQDGQIMSDRGTPMKKTSIEKIARSIAGLESDRPEGQSLITKKMANRPEGRDLLKRQYGSGYDRHIVEKVIKKCKAEGKTFYRVKWKNLPSECNKWISKDDL